MCTGVTAKSFDTSFPPKPACVVFFISQAAVNFMSQTKKYIKKCKILQKINALGVSENDCIVSQFNSSYFYFMTNLDRFSFWFLIPDIGHSI
jgi:hypothetical protein